jgi:hypothetical protein
MKIEHFGDIAEGFDSETKAEFEDVYEQARRTRAAVRGFINYLWKYESRLVRLTAELGTVNR